MNNNNIQLIEYLNRQFILVKTAHISPLSVKDVEDAFLYYKPDVIAIELDEDRLNAINNKDRWQQTDIIEIIKKKKVGYLLVNMILASFQRRKAKNLNSQAGLEMIKGIDLAKENNLPLALIDRPVKITFARIWRKLSLFEKSKLLSSIIMSIFDKEEISEEDLQNLKKQSELETALKAISKEFPTIKEVLVDERDAYLASKLKTLKGERNLVIIGAAHAEGIINNLHKNCNINDLEIIPAPKKSTKILKWLLPIALITIILYTLSISVDKGLAQIYAWLLWNGSLAALGTLIAGGHILTILTSFIMAPFTSLNPLLAVGWFSGIVEASLRKPQVKDFEALPYDTDTLKGFFHNKVTKILLVVMLSNIFSTLGTIISSLSIVKNFWQIF